MGPILVGAEKEAAETKVIPRTVLSWSRSLEQGLVQAKRDAEGLSSASLSFIGVSLG